MPVSPLLSHRAFPLIAAGLIAATLSGVAGAARSNKNWSDNLAGPDSSNFVALDEIKKSNVAQLEVAWSYPYATGGFNPVVVGDVMYLLGRNNSLIALDAATGKELWIHEGLGGIVSGGINSAQARPTGAERGPLAPRDGAAECDGQSPSDLRSRARHRRAHRSGAGPLGPRERRCRGVRGAKPLGSDGPGAPRARPTGAERGPWGPRERRCRGVRGAKPLGSEKIGSVR